MMDRPDFRSSIERWLLRVVVTGIGWPASVFLTALLIEILPFQVSFGLELSLDIVMGGLIIAAGQMFILRLRVKGIGIWLGYSLVGWAAGLGIILGLEQAFDQGAVLISGAAIGGGVYGLLQWLGLENELTGLGWWILQSAATWIAAYSLGYALQAGPGQVFGVMGGESILENGLLGWAVLSVIAGLLVVIAIPRDKSVEPDESGETGPWWPE
jgi:hypothetical protein